MRWPGLLFLVVFSSCTGPAAPDDELCRDVIERVCAANMCTAAAAQFMLPAEDCVSTVATRTGCNELTFTFTEPLTRARWLDCRLPLVRESEIRSAAPRCEYVDESVRNCPDLVTFLRGS
ncbi:MAG: hypothetical protein QM817_41155 [Archangium sp.]